MEPVHTGSRRVSSISAGILTTLRAFARASECSFGRVKEPTCVCVCVCGDEPSEGRNEKRTEKEGTGDRECLSRPFLKRVKRNERIAASRRSSSSRFFYFFLFSVKWLLVIICWFVVSFFFLSLSLSLSPLRRDEETRRRRRSIPFRPNCITYFERSSYNGSWKMFDLCAKTPGRDDIYSHGVYPLRAASLPLPGKVSMKLPLEDYSRTRFSSHRSPRYIFIQKPFR